MCFNRFDIGEDEESGYVLYVEVIVREVSNKMSDIEKIFMFVNDGSGRWGPFEVGFDIVSGVPSDVDIFEVVCFVEECVREVRVVYEWYIFIFVFDAKSWVRDDNNLCVSEWLYEFISIFVIEDEYLIEIKVRVRDDISFNLIEKRSGCDDKRFVKRR